MSEENINLIEEQEEIQADRSLSPKVNRELSPEALKVIINTHNSSILNAAAHSYDPTNIAHALEGLDQEDLLFFFKSVNSDDSAEIFTYLEQDTKESVVKAFSDGVEPPPARPERISLFVPVFVSANNIDGRASRPYFLCLRVHETKGHLRILIWSYGIWG